MDQWYWLVFKVHVIILFPSDTKPPFLVFRPQPAKQPIIMDLEQPNQTERGAAFTSTEDNVGCPQDQQTPPSYSPSPSERDQGSDDQYPRNLTKGKKNNSLYGSATGSANGGSGNNSDNSDGNGLDNNYFGFNFDADEGLMSNSNVNSEEDRKNDSGSDSGDVDSNNGGSQPVSMSHAEAAAAAVANLQSIVSAYNQDGTFF
jgi:hypothetical protein